MPHLDQFIRDYPEAMRKMFRLQDIASGPGYLNTYVVAMFAPLLFVLFSVTFAANAVTSEEEAKTIDVLLALPLPRSVMIAGKEAAMVAANVLLGAVAFLTLWLGSPLVQLHVGTAGLAASMVSQVLLGIAFGSLALAVGCATGRRGVTLGIGATLGVGGYLVYSLEPVISSLRPYRLLSMFHEAIANQPLRNGLSLGGSLALLSVAAVFVLGGLLIYNRRDLAT